MQKKALILVADGFQEEEFIYPYHRMKEEGWRVDVCPGGKGKYGIVAKQEGTLKIGPVWDLPWDCVLVPGGWQSPEKIRMDEECLSIVRAMNTLKRCVAAICHGPWVLASAGIMKDVRSTCYRGMRDDLIAAGANYTGNPVEVSGHIVTGEHYRDLGTFMKAVITLVNAQQRGPWRETNVSPL